MSVLSDTIPRFCSPLRHGEVITGPVGRHTACCRFCGISHIHHGSSETRYAEAVGDDRYALPMPAEPSPPPSDLATVSDLAVAHAPIPVGVTAGGSQVPRSATSSLDILTSVVLHERERREAHQETLLAPGATRAVGAGNRRFAEEPDRFRTCFERDLDRIQHSRAFRRLAGKCQVFISPEDDHLRNRLTHAIEVCQVAVSIARPAGLDVALTAAAATGHDCGHGPAGHAAEGALSPFLEGGYHHAVYGADVVLEPLNLCVETLDAIRNHSWNRPAPMTPEGEVVAWADRIAYVCHDFEDAVDAGIVHPEELPGDVTAVLGPGRRRQLHALITAMVESISEHGSVVMRADEAEALAAFRQFNYERIYLRPESVEQADRAHLLITELTEYFIEHPDQIRHAHRSSSIAHHGSHIGSADTIDASGLTSDDPTSQRVADAVRYVSGMTDRFLTRLAVDALGWRTEALPRAA